MNRVGISDIAVYLPRNSIRLDAVIAHRIEQNPNLKRQFQRALALIEQQVMRFPALWEDPVTMAAESALSLVRRHPRIQSIVRYIVSATETAIDMSKPIAAYVLGCLRQAGVALSDTLLTYQVQHACAGGSLALFGLATMIQQLSSRSSAILSCTDVARYEELSTAELTQGAGSVSLLLEREPELLDLDLEHVGMYASDVDDFFRPVWSTTAAVRGRFSIECYKKALIGAFEDYARQCGRSPETLLLDTDYIIVHAPFAKMAFLATQHLYTQYTDFTTEHIRNVLSEKGFFESLQGIQKVGNIYTASIFLVLRDQLRYAYRRYGEKIVGKTVLMCSYGSGNTMVCMQGRLVPGAAEVIQAWETSFQSNTSVEASLSEYETWLAQDQATKHVTSDSSRSPDGFFLQSIRDDGYRIYSYAEADSQTQK